MTYDVIVLGSGPGGYSAAIRAGQYGLKVAVVEKDAKLGGCCLHVGCIPTKSFLHTADVWEHFQNSVEDGIRCENPRLDFPLVLDRKNKIVAKHAKGVDFLMKKNKVDVIKGFGRLAGPGKLEVTSDAGTQIVEFKNIILATGSEARMLPGLQPDAKRILTNIEILNFNYVPKSLAVLGAGAVGVEFASCFHRFGSKVSVFEMLPRIVPVEDEDVSKDLERYFKKSGIRVETGAKVSNVQTTDTGVRFTATLANGKDETVEAEALLVAIGRKPNTEKIGLEGTRVQLDRGFIKVDEFQRTGEPGVYAIGDIVAGTPQLAHVATAEGMVAIAHIAGKPVTPVNKNRIPGATYTEPGIGSVGLTEAQARAAGHDLRVGKFPFAANSKASILGQHDGFVKIVTDAKYGEILGVHIIGPEAFELIGEGVLAMEAEATVETLLHTIHAHPTIYEAVGERSTQCTGKPSMPEVVSAAAVCELRDLGRMQYADAFTLQQQLVERRKRGEISDQLLIVEHPHVVTIGRNGHDENLLAQPELLERAGIDFHRTDRGGDVTYHGPGQIVGYPIVDLREWKRDVVAYVRALEQVLIDALAEFGITAGREAGATGVWTEQGKVAAIGVHVSRWVTSHGFALNVDTDLSYFRYIVPCGLKKPVTSLQALGCQADRDQVVAALARSFARVFDREMEKL